MIELLAVIAIMVILMGIVIRVTGYVQRLSMESRIRIEIKSMEAALEAYKSDFGSYPPLESSEKDKLPDNITNNWPNPTPVLAKHKLVWGGCWDNIQFVYHAVGTTNNITKKLYMNFNPKYVEPLDNDPTRKRILDPLGNPYGYYPSGGTISAKSPKANPGAFDLFSAGFDNKADYPNITTQSDDIGNWR